MRKYFWTLISFLSLYSCSDNKKAETLPTNDSSVVVADDAENLNVEEFYSEVGDESGEYEARVALEIELLFERELTEEYLKNCCTPAFYKKLQEHGGNVVENAAELFRGESPKSSYKKQLVSVSVTSDYAIATVYTRSEKDGDLVDVQYISYDIDYCDIEHVVFGGCNISDFANLPGKWGKSASEWLKNLDKLPAIANNRDLTSFAKYKFIDVDQDSIFELLADTKVEGTGTSALFTLCDQASVPSGDNIKLLLMDQTSINRIKFDLKQYQVFSGGFVGMGSIAERCAILDNSHLYKYYDYSKEVNPDNEEEFNEEASIDYGEKTIHTSIDEYKKNCTHGELVFAPTYDGSATTWFKP